MAQAIDPQIRSRRQTQLALLVLAVFLSVGAYVMVVLGTTGKTPANVAGFVVDLAAEQFTWMLIGIALFCLTLIVIRDDRALEAYTYTIGLVGVGLLLLPIVPGLGATINGERLWVFVGPISFQPSEASKVLLTIFLASYLDRRKELLAVATRRIGP